MSDEKWFNDEDSISCYLVVDPVQRWKEVERSGTRSARAWFILINSYMRDAHILAGFPGASTPYFGRNSSSLPSGSARQKIETTTRNMRDLLSNSLTCSLIAMPREISYHDEYLAFRATTNPFAPASRLNECAKYSIHIMVQLTRFMLHHQTVFRSTVLDAAAARETVFSEGRMVQQDELEQSGTSAGDRQAWEHYVDAANKIVNVVRSSSQEHVQFVNPFLANTIWLAAAAQVVSRLFGPPSIDIRLAGSNFDVLRGTLNLYVSFWGVGGGLKTKLDNLESRLDQVRRSGESDIVTFGQTPKNDPTSRSNNLIADLSGHAGRATPSGVFQTETAFPAASTPVDGMQIDSSDPLLGFNGTSLNMPEFSFNGDEFFDNLGLELDELFAYPYQ